MAHGSTVSRSSVASDPTGLAADVREGLSRSPKRIPPRWLYDARGSELFRQITELEAYYPTRCEHEILAARAAEIAAWMGRGRVRVVELGAGDGAKTRRLLEALLPVAERCQYVPADICPAALDDLAARWRRDFADPRLEVRPVAGDHAEVAAELGRGRFDSTLVLFLGSSIGNLHFREARRLMRRLAAGLGPRDLLLVGFDLKKPLPLLQRAYDDPQGVTRQFNLNLLDRLNRELGADFDREGFVHHACYNPRHGRMESWLVSRRRQVVHVSALGRSFPFEAWEGIHVECSYKYDRAQIAGLAREAGCSVAADFTDRRRWFIDSLWRPAARHPGCTRADAVPQGRPQGR